jgi:hypothetical protein
MRVRNANKSGNPNYPVCQIGENIVTNQWAMAVLAPRAGFEPATNRLTDSPSPI